MPLTRNDKQKDFLINYIVRDAMPVTVFSISINSTQLFSLLRDITFQSF